MTDKPTPTDAELEALLLDKLPASKHYIRPVIEKMVAAMQAAIDKWGHPAQAAEPVAWAFKYDDGTWHDPSTAEHSSGMRPLFAAPQPVAREPLDEARRLFDAGWKAAAMFCDREDVAADGIIGFGACPQFEAAFSAAKGISMALSNRDCRHGRQIGKCANCALDHMEMAAGAEARRVDELTALRKQDTALIRQLVEALDGAIAITMGKIDLRNAAIDAARARLESKP